MEEKITVEDLGKPKRAFVEKYSAKQNGNPAKVEHDKTAWQELKIIIFSLLGVLATLATILPLYTYAKGQNRANIERQIWTEQFPEKCKEIDSLQTKNVEIMCQLKQNTTDIVEMKKDIKDTKSGVDKLLGRFNIK